MKKITLIILSLLLFTFSSYSQSTKSIRAIIVEAHKSDKLKQAQWSLFAKYVDSGRRIINYNSRHNLAPASGLKLFTTAAALDILGENYKFKTQLYYSGSIEDGILKGNIYIIGGSDPTLGSDLVEGSFSLDSLMYTIYSKINSLGIKQIDGKIISDPHRYQGMNIPRRWIWEDIGNYYGAQTSALCLNDNLYEIFFKPNQYVNAEAELLRINPIVPGLSFTNEMKTGTKNSGDNGYVFCAPKTFKVILRGSIPQGKPEFKIKGAIPNPPLFAAQHLKDVLRAKNITVTGESEVSKKPVKTFKLNKLTEIISPPLKDIVFIINKKSYNMYTEQLLREIALITSGKAETKNGIDAVENFLERNGINTEGFNIYDGSGLSRSNTITARMMVDLLIAVSKKSYFESFYKSLGIAGFKDDLSSFKNFGSGTPIANNARIKSGYVAGVRSHSGYVKDSKGRTIAFSFIANNFIGSTSFINNTHKNIMIELAKMK